jgi:signal transduction histidine kinase
LDQFFAMASHDIRSPLSALSGHLEMAHLRAQRLAAAGQAPGADQSHVADPVARLLTALDQADDSLARLLRLVELLFDMARARAGTLTLSLAPCDLAGLVHEQVAAQRAAVPGRTIHLDVCDQPVMVVGDADRLGQVLTNYLTNALKYSPADRPVEVGVEVREGKAVVWVRDAGPGLPETEQQLIWGLYHRAPGVEAQSGSAVGLGLGLYICKRLIELHPGGQVGIESAVGEGSTFWFQLPLAAEARATVHAGT